MAGTPVLPNNYGFHPIKRGERQIDFTNSTTRTCEYGELVVVVDANSNAYVGVVMDTDGIAASATGKVDLMEGDVISTEQRADADTFVAGDTNVYLTIQDDSNPAEVREASATGRYPLKALVVATVNGADGRVQLRMPWQDGNIVAVV